jgi:hypothetical protein
MFCMRLFFEFQTSSDVQILTSAWNSHLPNLCANRREIYEKECLTKEFVLEIMNNAYFRMRSAVTPCAILKRERNAEISWWRVLYTGRNIFELCILLFHVT